MHIAIIGASGAIGGAMVSQLSETYPSAKILAFSRSEATFNQANVTSHCMDTYIEADIERGAELASQHGPLDLVVVATGLLHNDALMPEKSLRDLSAQKFQEVFAVNTIGPALVAKHFLPLLHRERRAVFAAISARVGSISDNHLGGWYAYRASKSALNMVLKNASIEMGRRYKQAIVVGLHPGTVDSDLSKPFQSHVADGKLFTPEQSAGYLLNVLNTIGVEDTGKVFAWDGQEIEY